MEVRLHSTLRGKCGKRAVRLDLPNGATVRDALLETTAQLPVLSGEILAGGDLAPRVIVFLNGRNVRFFEGLATVLHPNQVLDVFPRTGDQRAMHKQ